MHIIEFLVKEQKDSHTIASLWAKFEEKMFKPEIQPHQRAAMKLAFYSGAGCLMKMLYREIIAGEQSEEQATLFISALDGEVTNYINETDRSKN